MSAEAEASSLLLNQPIVVDNGTSSIKAGFAGSSKPKVRLLLVLHMLAFLCCDARRHAPSDSVLTLSNH